MVDLEGQRVLEVTEGRTEEATDALWETLTSEQREQIKAVSMDMWAPYYNSTTKHAPGAEIVHDRFHISKHLNEAVDQVRRSEQKILTSEEHFRWFWSYHHKGYAKRFFDNWYTWASRSRLTPIGKKAKMLKRHLPNLLTYVKHKITNSMVEGFNSKIQTIKSNARGFRDFNSYRIKILFYCGKLNLLPPETCHYYS